MFYCSLRTEAIFKTCYIYAKSKTRNKTKSKNTTIIFSFIYLFMPSVLLSHQSYLNLHFQYLHLGYYLSLRAVPAFRFLKLLFQHVCLVLYFLVLFSTTGFSDPNQNLHSILSIPCPIKSQIRTVLYRQIIQYYSSNAA